LYEQILRINKIRLRKILLNFKPEGHKSAGRPKKSLIQLIQQHSPEDPNLKQQQKKK
jgi:hypothetical protein